jgi:mxaC protein
VLAPLLVTIFRSSNIPSVAIIPHDRISTIVGQIIKFLIVASLACCLIAASGPYLPGAEVELIGEGAQIVMLIDRSASMNETFAGRNPSGMEESKATASKRILLQFIEKRRHDLVGVAAFSTSPMMIVPISDHPNAIKSAILAMDKPGLDYTNIARGLSMALSMFRAQHSDTSRAILLISDGAGVIDPKNMDDLRAEFVKTNSSLYWLYLRTKGSPGLSGKDAADVSQTSQESPEQHLNEYFKTLGIKYLAFEAEGAVQVEAAIQKIADLERKPVRYLEKPAKIDLSSLVLLIALFITSILLITKIVEVDFNHQDDVYDI